MQNSPKNEGETVLETLKFLLPQYANWITFLETISKFSSIHTCCYLYSFHEKKKNPKQLFLLNSFPTLWQEDHNL